mmetsp:Transcript_16968/g.39168  ORF Transcript_16968/g.39168 Transcript_16968/m.39168 type:complete len:109 (-) Transcript_16968:22-348(-)
MAVASAAAARTVREPARGAISVAENDEHRGRSIIIVIGGSNDQGATEACACALKPMAIARCATIARLEIAIALFEREWLPRKRWLAYYESPVLDRADDWFIDISTSNS